MLTLYAVLSTDKSKIICYNDVNENHIKGAVWYVKDRI